MILCRVDADGPTRETPIREFSIETTLGDRLNISCNTISFPPATVSWEVTNAEFPSGESVESMENFGKTIFLQDSNLPRNFTMATNAIVEFTDLAYIDDGVFECTIDNGFSSVSQSVQIRVKCKCLVLLSSCCVVTV